jgi:hypothetical protein
MEEEKAKQFPRRIEAIDKSSTLAVQAPSYRLRIVDEHISPSGTVIRGIGSKQEGEGVASALTATYGASEKLRASFSESTSVPTVDMDITGDRIEGLLIEGSGAKPRRRGHKSAIRKILNKINDIVEKTSHSDSPSIIIEKAYVKVHVPKEAKARARNIQKKPMEFSVPPWGLPAQNTAFVGRKEELSLLLNTFPKLGKAVIGQHITGLGGVGKTQLAIECLWQIYEQQQQLEVSSRYAVMIWLPGERAALELKLRSLAFWLGFGFGEEHPIKARLDDSLLYSVISFTRWPRAYILRYMCNKPMWKDRKSNTTMAKGKLPNGMSIFLRHQIIRRQYFKRLRVKSNAVWNVCNSNCL